jgi:hypothetical protein
VIVHIANGICATLSDLSIESLFLKTMNVIAAVQPRSYDFSWAACHDRIPRVFPVAVALG